jgi:hypothetical protein
MLVRMHRIVVFCVFVFSQRQATFELRSCLAWGQQAPRAAEKLAADREFNQVRTRSAQRHVRTRNTHTYTNMLRAKHADFCTAKEHLLTVNLL